MKFGEVVLSVVFAAITTAVTVALLAAAARRVLGLRVGIFRSVLAAVVALGIELGFESRVVWEQPERRLVFIPIQLGITLLAAMLVLAVAELFLPSGTWIRPDVLMRAVRTKLGQVRRGSELLRIAIRHGVFGMARSRKGPFSAAPEVRAVQAEALRRAAEEAGVAFVKLGQVLSTRQDLLPPEYISAFSRLQQRVDPVPWDEVEALLVDELTDAPDRVFAHIDTVPLAAASIGQVHRARLHTGEQVVVKVQRPGIRPVVERDLDTALGLARRLQASTSWGRSLGIAELAEGFAEALREELDFRIEARNMAALAAATSSHRKGPGVIVPKPHLDYSTDRVLVMDYMAGATLSSPDAIASRSDAELADLASALFSSLLRQVMVDGVFHADPHPGNIMILDDGRLALIDCGSVGRIDAELRSGLEYFMMAVDRGDPQQVCDALFGFVTRPESVDEPALRRSIGRFMALHMAPGTAPEVTMFSDLVSMVSEHDLTVPNEIAGAFRAIGTLEGTLTTIAPDFDMVAQSREFAAAQFSAKLAPSTLREAASDELLTLLPVLRRLPRHLDQITSSLEAGRLRVNVGIFGDTRDREFVTNLVSQVVLTVLAGISGIMAAMLLSNPGGPEITPTVTLYEIFGYNLLLISAVLGLRVLFVVFSKIHRAR